MGELSIRQQQVYNFIYSYNHKNGISPCVADIANGLGLSKSTIVVHANAIKKKGFISWRERIPRSFVIIKHIADKPARRTK